jgi:hypothetical protein
MSDVATQIKVRTSIRFELDSLAFDPFLRRDLIAGSIDISGNEIRNILGEIDYDPPKTLQY